VLRCALITALVAQLALPALAIAAPLSRFAIHGDGTIAIRSVKTGKRFRGRYRDTRGRYRKEAIDRITRVYGGDPKHVEARITLRFVELLAHLQHQLKGGWLDIASGYRSPRYNAKLRTRGRTVAKASMHLYAAAADLRLRKVASKTLWEVVRDRKLGGAGYYNSPWVHIDTGPPRSWQQGTAKVRSGVSDFNKVIIAVPQFDVYRAGERMRWRLARMTAYPIGVSLARARLEREVGGMWKTQPAATLRGLRLGGLAALPPRKGGRRRCRVFTGRAKLRGTLRLPQTLAPGRYRLRLPFCKRRWKAMPKEVVSYVFSVVARPARKTIGAAKTARSR
jgi:uncharacterized protein YcbK (DUF882 family)